ncbi:MAG: DUF4432 family protein [Phycisphaerae bacterium]|nr:DUF4432 family protein [Phycisphaerae bacterium]
MACARTHGPRIHTGYVIDGYEHILLENELLRVSVNVGRGSLIDELVYKPADIDLMFHHPGRLHPSRFVPSSYSTAPYMNTGSSGWMECFPSGSAEVTYAGATIGFHGEMWGLPFTWRVLSDGPDEVAVELRCEMLRTPLALTKTLRLRSDDPTLYIDEEAENLSPQALSVMWGHHPAIGPPFLAEGNIIEVPARQFLPDQAAEPPSAWPVGPDGLDYSIVRGPESRTEKMVFLRDLEEGRCRMINPELELSFDMTWDAALFKWFWICEIAGRVGAPWFGRAYFCCLEPFSSMPRALETGQDTVPIPPEGSIRTSLTAAVLDIR